MEHAPARCRHALDPAAAEDAVGPDHQDQDHQHVGREILGAAADIRVEIAGRQVLDDADDQPADHRADDRIEAAQDHHREHLQADQRQLVVDAEHRAPDDAAQRRDDAGHRPGQREIALDVDAHGHRHLLVVGDRAHRDADAALQEEPGEAGEEQEATPRPHELHRRQHDRPEQDRLVADRQRRRRASRRRRRSAPAPRSTAASPIVAMMTATTGRPSSGRSTTRSSPKPKPIMPPARRSRRRPERHAAETPARPPRSSRRT